MLIRGLSQAGDQDRLRTLVTAMIGLSHDLGYRVVAEGIETQEAAEILCSLACDELQGFWFARPMSADAFLSWYNRRDRHGRHGNARRAPGRHAAPAWSATAR